MSFAVAAFLVPVASVQSGFAQSAPSGTWKRIAGTTIDEALASPASGPVTAVWFAPGTRLLLAQTASGRIFETPDFIQWRLNTTSASPQTAARAGQSGSRLYRIGPSNLFSSDDGGQTWLNLTAFNGRSVIGDGFTSLAISPANPQEIVVSNQAGVWRSLDGGLSWSGVNENLPNLLARRLVNRRTVALADGSEIAVDAGHWTPVGVSDAEAAGAAHADAGSLVYRATADGRIRTSLDKGVTWAQSFQSPNGAKIDRIWVDSDRPEVALAASGSKLFRTVNGGLFWDDVSGDLPASQIHGIAADRSASVVYLATGRGLLSASLSLNDAGPVAQNWSPVAGNLPVAAAWDVLLNSDNTLTVALDGYGVFEGPAPHQSRRVRIVSGADLSDRPAAPGSLISVLGANITGVSGGAMDYPVIAASERSSQLQVPFDATSGSYSLTLQAAGERWTAPLTIKDAAPAIFVDADGAPLLLDAASGIVFDPNIAIHAGSSVQLLATGLGKVTPAWPTGIPAPVENPPTVEASVTAFLDGAPVQVTKATLAPGYVGYYIIELQIPPFVNRGAAELRVVMNGEESNRVRLNLEPDPAR